MNLVERRFAAVYLGALANLAAFGFSFAVIGAVLPRLIRGYGWSYAGSGVVLAAVSAGFFLSAFATGFLVRRAGLRAMAAAGLALEGAGCLLFGVWPSVAANALAGLLIGIGQGGVEVSMNTSVVRMEREGEHHLMGFVHAAFSVGAVLGPLAAAAVLAAGLPWQAVYRGLGAVLLAAAALQLFLPYGRLPAPRTEPGSSADGTPPAPPGAAPRGVEGRARRPLPPLVVLAFLLALLYVGIESGISSWAAQYAVAEFGFEARAASFTVSLFWAGLLVGRVAIPLLARRVALPLQLVVLGAGQALSVLLLALLRSPAWLYPLVLLSGLSFSSFFPLTMTIVGQRLRENQTVGLGLVSTGGGVGQFGFPFAMALIADRFGLRSGFLFFAALGLLLVAGCLGVLRETARR